MAKVKRFVKYISKNKIDGRAGFIGGVDYTYFNGKTWYAVYHSGNIESLDAAHPKACVAQDLWIENGPAPRQTKRSHGIKPEKTYLFVEPSYIWFAEGKNVIKYQWHKGHTLKTKTELDNDCYVGTGKFIVELP